MSPPRSAQKYRPGGGNDSLISTPITPIDCRETTPAASPDQGVAPEAVRWEPIENLIAQIRDDHDLEFSPLDSRAAQLWGRGHVE
jgi:hypothetical protein